MIRVLNIKMPIEHSKDQILSKIKKQLRLKENEIERFTISKRSIDARNKNDIFYVYNVDVKLKNEHKIAPSRNIQHIEEIQDLAIKKFKNYTSAKPVVVGCGPAGLFSALMLAEAGLNPIVIERGKSVEERVKDVQRFLEYGELNESSNIQFGEGGAGTFSDGKLTTGVNDVRIKKVLKLFVELGAPEEILYDAKPHIGTDNLLIIVKNLRNKIISLGGEFHFETTLVGLCKKDNILTGIQIEDKLKRVITIETNKVILAIGHSARDTFLMLKDSDVQMKSKSFSVGLRIEHDRNMINFAQYGKYSSSLPAASYKLSTHLQNGRGVYTFCMCPGGVVVPASSEKGHLAINGMSYYNRDAVNSNSAVLVGVNPKDFATDDVLSGMYFQRELEKKAYEIGGKYQAPVQLVGDFLKGVASKQFGEILPSYQPSTVFCDMQEVLPTFIIDSLRQGIHDMDRKLNGFARPDAILTAVESRSSSPVVILRDKFFNSNIEGLMPCGEGSGYAGGIMSAAIDGIKTAETLIDNQI